MPQRSTTGGRSTGHLRYPPDDPREWLNRAESNLALAQATGAGAYLEDLCFNAQQAVEKALKALLLRHGVAIPHTHNLALLITTLGKAGIQTPPSLDHAADLTRFAVITRYPDVAPPVTEDEYREALAIAEAVIDWVTVQLQLEEQ